MGRVSNQRRAELLALYAEWSGTQESFCKQHQVGLSTLGKWLRKARTVSPPGFVEVHCSPKTSSTPVDSTALTLHAGRASLVFNEYPAPEWLAEIIGRMA